MWTLHKLSNHRILDTIESHVSDTEKAEADNIWPEFSEEDLIDFPALRQRNFWCIQRHQATGKSPPILR